MAYWKVEVQLRLFLTSTLDAGEWLAVHPVAFYPGRSPTILTQQEGRLNTEGTKFLPLSGVEP